MVYDALRGSLGILTAVIILESIVGAVWLLIVRAHVKVTDHFLQVLLPVCSNVLIAGVCLGNNDHDAVLAVWVWYLDAESRGAAHWHKCGRMDVNCRRRRLHLVARVHGEETQRHCQSFQGKFNALCFS